jgi:hypothetical protein
MKTLGFMVALAFAIPAFGCGDEGGGEPTAPEPSGERLIAYSKSGGIAGVYEHLVVAEDGSATLEIGFRDEARQRFGLEPDELDRLRELLAAADFAGVGSDPRISCADCFQYEIEYAGATTAFAQIGDIPESVGEVVAELGRIVESRAPAQAPPG